MNAQSTLSIALAATLCTATLAGPADPAPDRTAPEDLPRLTVRWEDENQRDVFVVEGQSYRCRVGTMPAAILSLEANGTEILHGVPIRPGFRDETGALYVPAPADMTPAWEVWQGQGLKPATSSRARMNVWSASPYYWDAHLLDIPFVPAAVIARQARAAATEPVAVQTFETAAPGWEGLNAITDFGVADGALRVRYDGDDPYFQSGVFDVPGPVEIRLQARCSTAGSMALYWATTTQSYMGDRHATGRIAEADRWEEVRFVISTSETLRRFRLDPPGSSGTFELRRVEIRALDDSLAGVKPVRGEIIFHTFADRLNIEFRLAPEEGQARPAAAAWSAYGAAEPGIESVAGRNVCTWFGGPALLSAPGGTFGPDEPVASAPLTGSPRPGTWWTLRPASPGVSAAELFREELDPLPAGNASVTDGHWLGYEPASGLYRMESIMHGGGYGFNSAYDTPNRRMDVPVSIRAGSRDRRLLVKASSGSGILPSTVLTDSHGFMLPTPILSCKNFAGEREEPDDSAYGDAYFPLDLAAGEARDFRVVHLFQRWGDHMLKQITSIRFFQIYWHLSTGVSETTCFTIPHMLLNGEYVRIPDYRPYSGPFWSGQPQHDCLSWPGMLQYRAGGKRVRLMYDRTRFESITPNLARFTMLFTTSDGAGRAAVTATEIPQDDEMRTFLRVRYDWDRAVTLDGDARKTFRWLNVNDKKRARLLLVSDAEGKTVATPVPPEGGELLTGELLAGEFPFLGTHGIPGSHDAREYHSFTLIRSFRARLGGIDRTQPAASAAFSARLGNVWLTVPEESLTLQPGDFVEADLMLMPHAEAVEPDLKPERERVRFGTEGPALGAVAIGRKLADFPPAVEAEDEVVRATLTGGHNALPFIATGYREPGVPLLWQGSLWLNQQARGGDGYQVNPDGNGGYRFTFVIPLRHGMHPELTVTRASCTSPITEIRDRNGYPELLAESPGSFTLKAPALFAPGSNRVSADNPVSAFAGEGKSVRAVPVAVTPKQGTVTADITAWGPDEAELSVDGPCDVTVSGLASGMVYEVTVNGTAERREAVDGRIAIPCGEGRTALTLQRRNP